MNYPGLQVELHGPQIAVLTLNNPPAHTWTLESLRALPLLLAGLAQQPQLQALVITGAGQKFFSAGAELRLFADGDTQLAAQMVEAFGAAFAALADFRALTVAAINGYAMGGGLECALACDLRVAERQAELALPEASVGLLPCAGGTQYLSWLVGEAWAKRLILCGERLDAERALQIGLLQQVTDPGGALDAALQLAQKVTRQSPQAVAACKRLIHGARQQLLPAQLAAERDAFVALFGSGEEGTNQREGVQAFLQKRRPQWHYAANDTAGPA